MQDLQALLAGEPEDLARTVARPETWRQPAVGFDLPEGSAGEGEALKLYQASHGRFYLVAASLVCRVAGLPDRKVDAAAEEQISFVMRRLEPLSQNAGVDPDNPATYRELGWFGDRTSGTWSTLASPTRVGAQEERLPLFSLPFAADGVTRRLHAGLIPVASGETYAGGATVTAEVPELDGNPRSDIRFVEVSDGVLPSFAQLAEMTDEVESSEAREVLVFALLDLVGFLQAHLSALWQAVAAASSGDLPDGALAIFERFEQSVAGGSSWIELLSEVAGSEAEILGGISHGDLGAMSLSMTDIRQGANDLLIPAGAPALAELFADALGELPAPAGSAPAPAVAPGEAFYVVRCVYERPRCSAHQAPKVSEPSPGFRLAGFFDPDAPVRPLRISMPVDTSQKGLRRFSKGVSVLMSNQLKRQVDRLTSAKFGDLDEGDAGDDPGLPSLGMICSLSIPIITICAFILLMIIVSLLNIVFWWKPLFKICFPIKLEAK